MTARSPRSVSPPAVAGWEHGHRGRGEDLCDACQVTERLARVDRESPLDLGGAWVRDRRGVMVWQPRVPGGGP